MLKWLHSWAEISQDTLFDHLVFDSSQFLHHNVYKTRDQTSQEADPPTHHPTTDLQAAETLKNKTEGKEKKEGE